MRQLGTRQDIDRAKPIEIPALRAGMTEVRRGMPEPNRGTTE